MRQFKNSFPIDPSTSSQHLFTLTSEHQQTSTLHVHYFNTAPDRRMLCHYSSIQSLPAFVFPHGVKENARFFNSLYLRKSFENIPTLQGLVRILSKQKVHSIMMMKLNKLTVPLYKQVAGEQKYHPECFTCMRCEMFIGDGDSYILVEHTQLYW